MPPRTNGYSEKEINRSLNNPDINRVKNELRDMADVLRRNEPESQDGDEFNNDDAHLQRRVSSPRGRGPIANRRQAEREAATTERTDHILEELSRARGVDFSRFTSQGAQQEEDEIDDTVEDSLPPPRPRPQRPVARKEEGLLTNRDAVFGRPQDMPVAPPELSRVQALELELKTLRETVEKQSQGIRVHTQQPAPSRLRFVRKPSAPTPENYQKVDLMSDFIFYDFAPDDFLLRPIDAPTQVLITNAKQANDGNGDERLLFDALQNCMSQDLRSLTFEDLYYCLTWLQFNSYPNVPFDIKWTSQYGNENLFTLSHRELGYMRPRVSDEDLARFKDMGLDFPRVRDREVLQSDLDPEDKDVYRRAQYFRGNTPEEKVERFYGASAEVLAEYPKMMDACRHGVVDYVDVADPQYNPHKHVQDLMKQAEQIELDATRYKDDPVFYLNLMAEVDGLVAKASEIETSLKNGVRVEPNAERVTLSFSPLAFFPIL